MFEDSRGLPSINHNINTLAACRKTLDSLPLAPERTIIIWLAFGNPTLPTGRFAECFGNKAGYWIHKQIDSRTVEGTNKEEIARWERPRARANVLQAVTPVARA